MIWALDSGGRKGNPHQVRRRTTAAGKATAIFAAVLLASLGAVPASNAQVPFAQADFSAFATGTVLHADALQQGLTRLANVDIALSSAAADGNGLVDQQLSEVQREINPDLGSTNKVSYAQGLPIGVGLQQTPDTDNQIQQVGRVEADALPNTTTRQEEIGPVNVDPAAFAALVRARASAFASEEGECPLGEDLARGLAYAADVQLLDTGGSDAVEGLDTPIVALDAEGPSRAVSQSLSRNTLIRQINSQGGIVGPNFGLLSEVRQTIAPVTILRGTPQELTIEVLGEWVLQVVAGGLPGTAFVHYGPGEVTPQTPLLRLINAAGDVTNVLTSQAIVGQTGLVVPIPGVAEIVVGEDPRAIGGDHNSQPTVAANGTSASAAVDVVRVKLLEQTDANGNVTLRAADLRVGHMEAQAQVPAGGISCSIPVTKSADPANILVGQTFRTPITVTNPFNCDLVNVRIEDVITTEQNARFRVNSTDPGAAQMPTGDNLASATIVWEGLGPIEPGDSLTVTAEFLAQGGVGDILDTASATGTLANCRGEDTAVAGAAVGIEGVGISGVSPRIDVPVDAVLPRTGPVSPATVASGLAMIGLAISGIAASRRFFRG